MRPYLASLIFLLAISDISTEADAGGDKPILVVFDVEAKMLRLDAQLLDGLADHLSTLLTETGKFKVVPRSQVQQRLRGQQRESFKDCYDRSCQVELGRELAAQKTASTQVLKLGKTCKVNLTLFDLRTAATESAASVSGPCATDHIVNSLERAVDRLVGRTERAALPPPSAEQVAALESKAATSAAPEPRPESAPAMAMAPGSDSVQKRDDALVHQPDSDRVWQRCPVGQRWDGAACQGKAQLFGLASARRACPPGFRLPTRQDFISVLGSCDQAARRGAGLGLCKACAQSPVCRFLFGRDLLWYWATSGDNAFGVNFKKGRINDAVEAHQCYVRCVKGR